MILAQRIRIEEKKDWGSKNLAKILISKGY